MLSSGLVSWFQKTLYLRQLSCGFRRHVCTCLPKTKTDFGFNSLISSSFKRLRFASVVPQDIL
ncbi:hypothetical protein HanIR_Chr09g0438001 [Helianthus annuus]|nr:hypothetical protein HanIR_Chr09g0438001 [Helianthus annuus]